MDFLAVYSEAGMIGAVGYVYVHGLFNEQERE